MSSRPTAYHLYPLDNQANDRMQDPFSASLHEKPHRGPAGAAYDPNHRLSPSSSMQVHSNSASPSLHDGLTPAESLSALSVQYQSSVFSEVDDDPFFGASFSDPDFGNPSFLDDSVHPTRASNHHPGQPVPTFAPEGSNHESDKLTFPLSPDKTPSLPTTSPPIGSGAAGNTLIQLWPDSISPQQLSRTTDDLPAPNHAEYRLTPKTNDSAQSSDDSAIADMAQPTNPVSRSPLVTISLWPHDGESARNIDSETFGGESKTKDPSDVQDGTSTGDGHLHSSPREGDGSWMRDPVTGHGGIDPENRSSTEVPSTNELAALRKLEKRRQQVHQWLLNDEDAVGSRTLPDDEETPSPPGDDDGIPDKNISMGDQTENVIKPGQTYFTGHGGEITATDIELMNKNRNWSDAPVLFPISQQRYQPQSSREAMQWYERMCQDNRSEISRVATWGTRRHSIHSVSVADIDEVTSGNILKKFSISGRLEGIRQTIARRPSASQILKRTHISQTKETKNTAEPAVDRRGSRDKLGLPQRTPSRSKKPMPSVNTAIASMGHSVAMMGGAIHARSGSISNTPITSPKSPMNLRVRNAVTRPRSKSDQPVKAGVFSGSSLAEMWRKTGGPPVAIPAKTAAMEQDEEDEDEEDLGDDLDTGIEPAKTAEEIVPNIDGFRQHILRLNPMLAEKNMYLVDRIAYQQNNRFKSLLNKKAAHIQHLVRRGCPAGLRCEAQGGSALLHDQGNTSPRVDPLSTHPDGSNDADQMPLEGVINTESFPHGIPMPPARALPATFECQLCYQAKRFQKPSDWTKHVHEDVQPFTCTWDRCREPKIFKRKADWVRHENEGHRHLEWWTCDVDECRHTCYRRDNFLQHLVREHKFTEPKIKTKAAMKKAGGIDPTWHKVEGCHYDTDVQPADEPCHFCGKTFASWKKLTVHLAKHMEQISLPILKLVELKDLEEDTIISPAQDPPPRTFEPTPIKQEAPPFPIINHSPMVPQQMSSMSYAAVQQDGGFNYPASMAMTFPQKFYDAQFGILPSSGMVSGSMNTGPIMGVFPQEPYRSMPIAPTQYGPTSHNPYISAPVSNLEPFPPLTVDALGLQDPMGGHMPYDGGMMESSSIGGDQFTPQGSISPYLSPHHNQGGFYNR